MPKIRGAVSGVVTDAIGPVAGVAVFVKDGANGVTTDLDGAYTLTDLNLNDVIVVSLLGYQTQEIVYTGQTTLNVLLAEESTLLEGVVVTAMGIERQEESLTYAAETVGGNDVNDIKSLNMINSLQGKAAGPPCRVKPQVWSSPRTLREPADRPRSSSEAASPSVEVTSLLS